MSSLPTLPGYRIERELGRGGMAAVYLAEQLSLQRRVAVKLLQHTPTSGDSYPQVAERFLREARTLAELRHPNVVVIHDVVASQHGDFIAMEYLQGGRLADRLKQPLAVPEALGILAQLAGALAAAHARGIVHRDVKPENVLFRDAHTPVLTDFGIAQQLTAAGPRITEAGMLLGTPTYMAPEQIEGGRIDGRSDLYSLGVVFYEMLTGHPPFDDASSSDLLLAHLARPVPALPSRLAVLQPVLDQMLAKRAEQRYPDMNHLLADLGRRLLAQPALLGPLTNDSNPTERLRALGWPTDELDLASPRPRTTQVLRPLPRTPRRLRLLAGVLTALVLLAGVLAWQRSEPPDSRRADGAASAPAAASERSIAVLPFADLSSQRDDNSGYFADGLSEELIAALSQLPGLRVAARSSAFQFRDGAVDLREVGRRLKVGSVLEGSVRREGERLRINVRLVDVDEGFALWSSSFDRPFGDVFAIQEDVARAVVDKLQLRTTASASLGDRGTADAEAWELFLRARQIGRRGTVDDHRREVALLEQALRRDPDFARALAQVARSLLVQSQRGSLPRTQALREAEPRALRALALRPDEPEVQVAVAQLRQMQGDYAAAERAFRRALQLDPNNASALGNYDYLLWELGGREQEERAVLERSVALDPLSPLHQYNLAELYVDLGEFPLAHAAFRQAIAVQPDSAFGYTGLGRYHWLVEADADAALAAFAEARQRDGAATRPLAFPALLMLDVGDLEGAANWLAAAGDSEETNLLRARATLAVQRGELETAAALLDPVADTGDRLMQAASGQLALLRGDLDRAERQFRALLGDNALASQPSRRTLRASIGLAYVLGQRGDRAGAQVLLQSALEFIRTLPLHGGVGAMFSEVEVLALLDRREEALARLSQLAEAAVHPSLFADLWSAENNPYLASLRDDVGMLAWLQSERLHRDSRRQAASAWRTPERAMSELQRRQGPR